MYVLRVFVCVGGEEVAVCINNSACGCVTAGTLANQLRRDVQHVVGLQAICGPQEKGSREREQRLTGA